METNTTLENTQSNRIFIPKEFKETPTWVVKQIVNGCGPKEIGSYWIPNSIWGITIRIACDIHDFEYYVGETEEDKKSADLTFLNNMIRLIEDTEYNKIFQKLRIDKFLKVLAKRTAKKYYYFVSEYGGPAFWDNKNEGK